MHGNTPHGCSLGRRVYLDYAATTPVDERVIEAMSRCLGRDGIFGNPASRSHCFGLEAQEVVEMARVRVARLIGADPAEIVWTSGATESVNLAVKGVVRGAGSGRHVVTTSMEHKATLDCCALLEREGYGVTYVDPDPEGTILPARIEAAIRDDTVLVSLTHVNNEVGTATDIAAVGEITSARGIALHVDAAQSGARLALDVREVAADLVSLSGHKMYGPKGAGALYVRSSCPLRLEPQMHGGDQEHGLRSGTLPTHQIVGMGVAARIVQKTRTKEESLVQALDRRLRERLLSIPRTILNGSQEHRVPGILNVEFVGADSEALMMALKHDVGISSGSACTSARVAPSHVLMALGLSEESANCSVRFSLGRFTTENDVDQASTRVAQAVEALRRISSQSVVGTEEAGANSRARATA